MTDDLFAQEQLKPEEALRYYAKPLVTKSKMKTLGIRLCQLGFFYLLIMALYFDVILIIISFERKLNFYMPLSFLVAAVIIGSLLQYALAYALWKFCFKDFKHRKRLIYVATIIILFPLFLISYSFLGALFASPPDKYRINVKIE